MDRNDIIDSVTRRVHWSRASCVTTHYYALYLLAKAKLRQVVSVSTCIPIRLFTAEFANWTSSVQFVRCKQALTVYYKLPTFVECYYYDTYWQFNDVDLMRSIRFTLSTLVP